MTCRRMRRAELLLLVFTAILTGFAAAALPPLSDIPRIRTSLPRPPPVELPPHPALLPPSNNLRSRRRFLRTLQSNTPPAPPPRPPPPKRNRPLPPPLLAPPSRAELAKLLKASSAVYRAVASTTKFRNGAVLGQIPYGFANEPSRRGAYYLPSQFRSRSIPVMLVFHGFMGNGLGMVNTFKWNAEKFQFAVVGVDSQFAYRWDVPQAGQSPTPDYYHALVRPSPPTYRWDVPQAGQFPTPDYYHALACLAYVRSIRGVRVDASRITTAGISMGGYMAAGMATNYATFTSGMIFHSKFLLDEIGPYAARLWISTGLVDRVAIPSVVKRDIQQLQMAHPNFPQVFYAVFRTGHCATCKPAELTNAMIWWLYTVDF